jgi:hypothetical protein
MTKKTNEERRLTNLYNFYLVIANQYAIFTLFFGILAFGWYYPQFAGYSAILGVFLCSVLVTVKGYQMNSIDKELKQISKGTVCYCGLHGTNCKGFTYDEE